MLKALAGSCHPGPTAAVTAIVTAVAWRLGWRPWELVVVALAVLLGQLSIGWSNDAHDIGMDAASGRSDKPAARGEISGRVLWSAAAVALVASCALSWWLAGVLGGTLHVIAVLAGWLYNLVLARTVLAWLPYLIAFTLLPSFLTIGLGQGVAPAWLRIEFGLVALAAHLTNSLRDLKRDRAANVRGTAGRLGPRVTMILAFALLAAATALLAVVLRTTMPIAAVLLVVAFVAACVIGLVARRQWMFRIVIAIALVDTALMVLAT